MMKQLNGKEKFFYFFIFSSYNQYLKLDSNSMNDLNNKDYNLIIEK